jgi:uncharacterized protein involved in exopolysaccharide biosynthesis
MEQRPNETATLDEDSHEPVIAMLFARLWRAKGLLLGLVAGCALIAYGLTWLVSPKYTARVTLLPRWGDERVELLSRFAGLTGMPVGTASAAEAHYGRIVTSNLVLDALIERSWLLGDPGRAGTLFEALGVEVGVTGADSLRARNRLRERLRRKVIAFSRDRLTGFMELRITLPRDRHLAVRLANELATELDRYNRDFLRLRAAEQRSNSELRLQEATKALRQAEDSLAAFLRANRAFEQSPDLARQHAELRREVDAQNALWIELKRQLEIARLDEQNQMLSLDILDRADLPTRPSSPRRGQIAAMAGMAGLAVGLAISLVNRRFDVSSGR